MLFILSKKLFSFSRYSFFSFFPSFPYIPDSKGQIRVEWFTMSKAGVRKLTDVIFGITQKPHFNKEFLAWNGCFGLFIKIKRGSGTNFWCTFSAGFFHTNVPYLIFYRLTKFQYHTFFLLKISNKLCN